MRQVCRGLRRPRRQQNDLVSSPGRKVAECVRDMAADESGLYVPPGEGACEGQAAHEMPCADRERGVDAERDPDGAAQDEAPLARIAGATSSARDQSSSVSMSWTRQRGTTSANEWRSKIRLPS